MQTMNDKPLLIGVSPRIYYPGTPGVDIGGVWTKTLHYLEQSVARWIDSGGALAVMIPALDGADDVAPGEMGFAHYAAALDGLVLQGGNDVAPENYGEAAIDSAWHGDSVRDAGEMALIEAFVDAGKPVFGICRGLQLLNVSFGGTLLQDIATQHPGAGVHRDAAKYERHFHAVELVAGTRLAQLYPGRRHFTVNSIHHQGIKDLGQGFVVEARCPEDGMIEAIRRRGPGYIAAVQWHPEFHDRQNALSFDDAPMLRDAARAARQR